MSEADEEVIREAWRRWNAGERPADDPLIDPEVEVHSGMVGDVFVGAEGVRRWMAEIDEQFESYELLLDGIRDVGNAKYVAHGAIRARGLHSGVDLDEPASWVFEMRAGRIRRLWTFIGRDAPRQAEELGG